ncbi:MAG TPA: efflux transporter outer membrane subunit [Polyangium sp.]|nr:efflux transporter outer membrane subunit [Polyangium sp.]
MRTKALLLTALCALTGCASLDTSAKVPEVKLPGAYATSAFGQSIAAMNWKDYFADEHLNGLITIALQNNFDLLMALQRIEIARAGIKQTTGALFPQVSLGVGAGIRKFGLYTMDGSGNATTEITPGKLVPVNLPDLSLGLQASWEVDVWGKLRSMRGSARAQYLATIEGTNLVITNLVADIAIAYFELIAFDHAQEVLGKAIASQSNMLELMQAQKEAGRTNELAVKQFEAQVVGTKALLAESLLGSRQLENQINLLLGRVPQPIPRSKDRLLRDVAATISAGVPSDLLRNRADIREAEQLVEASKFDVTAARAAFFPSLTLGAGVGFQAFDPRYLFITPESLVYSLAGGILAPLVNRSEIEAQFDSAKAMQVQALYNYQSVILRSFVEVANGFIALERTHEIVAQKKLQKEAVSQTVDAADALFRAGKATYLDVLVAQQNTLGTELELIDRLKERHIAAVNLYRALGGGWRDAH